MSRTYEHTFDLDDERSVIVEYTAEGGDPGSYSSLHEDSYPATAPEIEIVKAVDMDGDVVVLTPEQDEKFCDWLAQNHEDDDPDYGWDD